MTSKIINPLPLIKRQITFLCIIFMLPFSAFATSDSGTVPDSGSPEEVSDFLINNCVAVKRENLCNILYPVDPDSSLLDDPDSSITSPDYSGTTEDCSNFDFSGGHKMTICHNGHTINVATQGACNGHFPNHAGDTLGACGVSSADSGSVPSGADSGTITDNSECIGDADNSSAIFITADQLADSGIYNEVYDCVGTPSDPDNPDTNSNIIIVPGSGKSGRLNWRELFSF